MNATRLAVTVDQIMKRDLCYEIDLFESLFAGRESMTALDILALNIPAADRLWAVLHPSLVDEVTLHTFACDEGERALDIAESKGYAVDERSRRAIKVKRAWIVGNATDADLATARTAAWAAAWAATGPMASSAARAAAWAAAGPMASFAALDAACAAATAAARLRGGCGGGCGVGCGVDCGVGCDAGCGAGCGEGSGAGSGAGCPGFPAGRTHYKNNLNSLLLPCRASCPAGFFSFFPGGPHPPASRSARKRA